MAKDEGAGSRTRPTGAHRLAGSAGEGSGTAAWQEVSATGVELRFEDFLTFKLGRLHSLVQREVTSRYLEPSGLTHPEWRLLARLSGYASLEMRELTRINLMDKAAISRAVDSLIEKGFVDRHIDPTHAKRRIIAVTTAGRRVLRKVFPAAQKEQATLLRLLSAGERQVLDTVLVRLTDTLLQSAAASCEEAGLEAGGRESAPTSRAAGKAGSAPAGPPRAAAAKASKKPVRSG
ncbi:MAG TPA: MarR family winged helix-turn-helix transcriptional regulator [Ideonella sp.]|nr:MarR family winged helix-turn-helix transcriptional regulator [Ideonella sp.]